MVYPKGIQRAINIYSMRKGNTLRIKISILFFITLCFAFIEAAPAALKVGLIYDITGRGDLSFCDAAYAGAKKAEEAWGFKLTEVTPSLSTDTELTLRRLAKLRYDLIIGVGFLFQEPMDRVARDFPDTKFALIDAIIDQPNVASLTYRAHEGTFLAGVLSALKTGTEQIGFIGGMKVPLVEAFEIGYRAGIQAANPEAELVADYVGVTPQAFNDPAKAKELALAQYNRGVDIILAAAGASSLGVLEAAKTTGKWIIWVDSNGNALAPGLVLTSVIKGVEISVYETIKSVQEGTFSGGLKDYGLKEGGVEYIVDDNNRELLPSEILEQVAAFEAKIIAGDITVPHQRQ